MEELRTFQPTLVRGYLERTGVNCVFVLCFYTCNGRNRYDPFQKLHDSAEPGFLSSMTDMTIPVTASNNTGSMLFEECVYRICFR